MAALRVVVSIPVRKKYLYDLLTFSLSGSGTHDTGIIHSEWDQFKKKNGIFS